MTPVTSPRQAYRTIARALLATMLMLVAVATAGGHPARAQAPGVGSAQVIAQGVVGTPAEAVAWQILVQQSATTATTGQIDLTGEFLQTPGFYLAANETIRTTTPELRARHLLDPGEAAFTDGNGELLPYATSETALPYYAITLVSAANPARNPGAVVFTSDLFPVPPSVRDLNLFRAVLQPGEAVGLGSGEFPGLLFVGLGQIDLATPAGDSAVITTEQAVTFTGEITAANSGPDPAELLFANIGAQFDAPSASAPAAPAAAQPAAAPLLLTVQVCPEPADLQNGAAVNCTSLVNTDVSLADLNLALGGQNAIPPDALDGDTATWLNPLHGDLFLYTNAASLGYAAQRLGSTTLVCCRAGALPITIDTSSGPNAWTLYLFSGPGNTDADNDGLYGSVESSAGTDPNDPDTDDDGLTDGEEISTYRTNPLSQDTDNDSYPDLTELSAGTDPLDANDPGAAPLPEHGPGTTGDQDADGLTDGEETELGTDPLNPDTDFDGRPDGDETRSLRPTDPFVADSDGDGLLDGEEVNTFGTDPASTDPDNDGFTDSEELNAGTNPNDPLSNPAAGVPGAATDVDTDGDGISDGRELETGTDPNHSDTDGDGMSDGTEVHLGMDPTVVDQ